MGGSETGWHTEGRSLFHPRWTDRAAMTHCRAEMCLTDESTLEDKALRAVITHSQYSLLPHDHSKAFFVDSYGYLNPLVRHGLAQLRAGLCDRHVCCPLTPGKCARGEQKGEDR